MPRRRPWGVTCQPPRSHQRKVNNVQRVVIHNPEILEQWLQPMAEQMKQRIDGADPHQLFAEAQDAFMVLSAAVMQMSLEDVEADATPQTTWATRAGS